MSKAYVPRSQRTFTTRARISSSSSTTSEQSATTPTPATGSDNSRPKISDVPRITSSTSVQLSGIKTNKTAVSKACSASEMSNKTTNGYHGGSRAEGAPQTNGHSSGQANMSASGGGGGAGGGTTATVSAPPLSSRSRPQSSTSSLSHTNQTEGYVGFANLPNQVYRKSVKKGFEFTLMVVGESGLGKSTLVNSMFIADLYEQKVNTVTRRPKTLSIEKTTALLKEGSVQLKLTVVDTPGFGDVVDNSNCWQPIINYVETRFDEYLNAETKVNRKTINDDRVHCCIYFISPTGHGLKQLDIEFMKRLHDKVNIIPLIAKADTMTPEECKAFKKTILSEIYENKIRIYEFPETEDGEDNKQQKKHKERIPFAVVGSNTIVETSSGRKVRGRVYPWGVVEVENLEHNDYITLRNMLIRTHMQDLKDITNNVHYENFRYKRLSSSTSKKGNEEKDPMTLIADEKKEHNLLLQKRTVEMEHLFEQKVKDKLEKLQESDISLARKKAELKGLLEQKQQAIDEQRRQFEKEKEQENGTLKHKKKLLAF